MARRFVRTVGEMHAADSAADRAHRQLSPSGKVKLLDIGCGNCDALNTLTELGVSAHGLTFGTEDLRECDKQPHAAEFEVSSDMDMHDLDFPAGSFSLVWARHSLEHSMAPLFVLFQIFEVLSPGGFLYVEVPAADTSAAHGENPNHYSGEPACCVPVLW